MLLLIDIGNTQTVIGIHDGNGPIGRTDATSGSGYVAKWRIATGKGDSADDLLAKLFPLFQMAGIEPSQIKEAAFSCVVPSLSISWDHAVRKLFGTVPLQCSAKIAIECGLFATDYPNAEEIGADRVADAVAAREEFGSPVVVVDFGTATNIEVLDSNGAFIGGIIAPGIMTSSNALFKSASKISGTDLTVPEHVIGRSTTEAVKSGLIYGEVGRVDGILERVFEEMGARCTVVATGGLVHTVSKLSDDITAIRPELTLDGLRLLLAAS